MAKKKKKGKGKKKAKQVPSLSNVEKQTLQITIENLEKKIKWRKELNEIVEEEISLYEEVNELELRDKRESVCCLENALQDLDLVCEKFKTAIPEENKMRVETEEITSSDLATKLKSSNEEKIHYDAKLQSLKLTLADLESYDISEVDTKISETEKSLKSLENNKPFEEECFVGNLENYMKYDMRDMFWKKIAEYQENISTKVDENLLRIIEETRWWKNSAHILLNMKEDRVESNRMEQQRREKTSECSSRIQEIERKIVAVEERISELQTLKENERKRIKERHVERSLNEMYEKNIKMHHLELKNCIQKMVDNENRIKTLEKELSVAENVGYLLSDILKQALDLISDEMENPLIKNFDDPPEKTDLLIELDSLCTKAIHMIHNSTHQ